MNPTRQLAALLRTEPNITPTHLVAAATAIDALLDAIEAGGLVSKLPAPSNALRNLRLWHHVQAKRMTDQSTMLYHDSAVRTLNVYFPKDDQL